MKWQPIETAPKDGTEILLCRNGRVSAGEWQYFQGSEYQDEFEYWYSIDGGFDEDQPPTHWMPLPEPPQDDE